MPLSNADNPAAEQPVEPVPPKKASTKSKAVEEPKPELVKASTSGSADVQNLLARREIAVSNGDDVHVAALDAELAELGFRI